MSNRKEREEALRSYVKLLESQTAVFKLQLDEHLHWAKISSVRREFDVIKSTIAKIERHIDLVDKS